jgi:hypothetical protein
MFDDNLTDAKIWGKYKTELIDKGYNEQDINSAYNTRSTKGKTKWDLNSKEAIQNRLLEAYFTLLTDPIVFAESKASLDTPTSYIKDVMLDKIGEKKGDGNMLSYEVYSPMYHINKKREYTIGKIGIGPMALSNAHHVLAQITGLKFAKRKMLDRYGISDLSGIKSKYGKDLRILDWFSALINAHVDVAKDPYIVRFNVVPTTYNMLSLLIRTGFGENSFYFLAQPILKDMSRAIELTTGRLGVDTNKSKSQLRREAIQKLASRYIAEARATTDVQEQIDELNVLAEHFDNPYMSNYKPVNVINDEEFLLSQIRKGKNTSKSVDYYIQQLNILASFLELSPVAEELSQLVKLSQIDTKKFGNNFIVQHAFETRLKHFIVNSDFFERDMLTKFFTQTILDKKFRNSVLLAKEMFNNTVFRANSHIHGIYDNIVASIDQLTNGDEMLSKGVANGIISTIKGEFFAKYTIDNNIKVYPMLYGDNTIAKRLIRLRNDIINGKYPSLLTEDGRIDNALLNHIDGRIGGRVQYNFNAPDYVSVGVSSETDSYTKNQLKLAFNGLLNHEDPTVRKFAHDLAIYAFFVDGDNMSSNNIFGLVPIEFRQQIGYTEFIRHTMDQLNAGVYQFDYRTFFRSNWHNKYIVPEYPLYSWRMDAHTGKNTLVAIPHLSIANQAALALNPKTKSIPYVLLPKNIKQTGVTSERKPIYPPYIRVNTDMTSNPETTYLYELIGYRENKNYKQPIYKLVNKLGYKYTGSSFTENASIYRGGIINDLSYPNMSSLPFNNIDTPEATFSDSNQAAYERLMDELIAISIDDYVGGQIIDSVTNDTYSNIIAGIDRHVVDDVALTGDEPTDATTWSQLEALPESYFNEVVLPFINDGKAYQFEYKYIGDTYHGDMSDIYTAALNEMYPGVDNKVFDETSVEKGLDDIKSGRRTAQTTVNSVKYWSGLKVGDIISFDDNVYVMVTQPLRKLVMPESGNNDMSRVTVKISPAYTKTFGDLLKDNNSVAIFTENAQHSIEVLRSLGVLTEQEYVEFTESFPSKVPKLNVNGRNNQSNIRTLSNGTINPNAYGIVTKKYANYANPNKGVFEDTTEDFNMFKLLNDIVFDKLFSGINTNVSNIYLPIQFALNKSALPYRFATYLSDKLNSYFYNSYDVVEHPTIPDKYGLQLKDNSEISTNNGITIGQLAKHEQLSQLQTNNTNNNTGVIFEDIPTFDANKPPVVINNEELSSIAKTVEPILINMPIEIQLQLKQDLFDQFNADSELSNILLSTNNAEIVIEEAPYFSEIIMIVRNAMLEHPKLLNNNPSNTDNPTTGGNTITVGGNTIDLSTELGIKFRLSDQQVKAVNDIFNWYTGTSEQSYTLEGYAGTGKTTVTRVVAYALSKHGNVGTIQFAAPSHAAKNVLSIAANSKAFTVHALLGLNVTTNLNNYDVKQLSLLDANNNKIANNALVIIDEASMIDNNVLDVIVAKTRARNARVLFMGDPKQLNPVNQFELTRVFNTKQKTVLTQTMRQSDENAIIAQSIKVRENIDQAESLTLPKKPIKRDNGVHQWVPNIRATFDEFGNGVVKLNKDVKRDINMLNKWLSLTLKYRLAENPLYIRWLAYSDTSLNPNVSTANANIRKLLGYTLPYQGGEILKVYDTIPNTNLENSAELQIVKNKGAVQISANIANKKTGKTIINFGDYTTTQLLVQDINNTTSEPVTINVLDDYTELDKFMTKVKEYMIKVEDNLQLAYEQYYKNGDTNGYNNRVKTINSEKRTVLSSLPFAYTVDLQVEVLTAQTPFKQRGKRSSVIFKKSIDYGYASTVHKAQGSTYENVVLDYDNFELVQNDAERMRLIYTALTRAKHTAIIIGNQSIDTATNEQISDDFFVQDLKNDENYNNDTASRCK